MRDEFSTRPRNPGENGSSNDLNRFVTAQKDSYESVIAELNAGQKSSHWMWYIFPQIRGLGHSPMAIKYAIQSQEEARAYAQHPVLGERLKQCTRLVNAISGKSIDLIFGFPDNLKFRSCMTLFAECAAESGIFEEALRKYFNGEPDPLTIQILARLRSEP